MNAKGMAKREVVVVEVVYMERAAVHIGEKHDKD